MPRRNAVVARLRARVPKWYAPEPHVAFSILLTAVVVAVLLWQLRGHEVRWSAWFGIPAAFMFANAVEYGLHRFPMHRRMRLFDRFFRGHTLVHHRYFDHEYYELESRHDVYFVLTTANTLATSLLLLAAAYFGLGAVVGTDVAVLATITMAAYSLATELLHLAFHLPRAWLERRWFAGGWFQFLREHHLLHHDPRVMRRWNFNIVLPLMDWLLGTRLPSTAYRGEVRPAEFMTSESPE